MNPIQSINLNAYKKSTNVSITISWDLKVSKEREGKRRERKQ